MALKRRYIRDGRNRLVGSITSGYAAETAIVRDAEGHMLGRTSSKFRNTRDARGKLISVDSAEPGLLFGQGDEED